MSSPPTPEGPGSVAGAPHLPDGFTGTFTSRHIDTGELRQHVVTGGAGPPLLLVHGWPQTLRDGRQPAEQPRKTPSSGCQAS
jgi:pimeloyl-ACP methyl ester carboxylesterase